MIGQARSLRLSFGVAHKVVLLRLANEVTDAPSNIARSLFRVER